MAGKAFVATGSIWLRPGIRKRPAFGRGYLAAGREIDALVRAAPKVCKPFIVGAAWRRWRRPRPRRSAAASTKLMSTINSTFSGTELPSSARLHNHHVDVAPAPRDICAGHRRRVDMRARVAAAAEQARRKRTPQTPRFRRVMRRRTGSGRQRQVEARLNPAIGPGGEFEVTTGTLGLKRVKAISERTSLIHAPYCFFMYSQLQVLQ